MASYNHVELIGNIGRLEAKTFSNGSKIVEASLATTRKYKDRSGALQEDTQWHRLVLRGSCQDFAEKYVGKGDCVHVTGELTYRDYEDRDGNKRTIAEVQTFQLDLLAKKATEGTQANTAPAPAPAPSPAPQQQSGDDFADLPF